MSERPIRICLIGHSTRSDNLGVGALTVSEVEILRGIACDLGRPLEITITDFRDARPAYVAGPDIHVVDISRKMILSPLGFLAIARRSDAVIDIGAGDSFTDIYGTKRLTRMFLMKAIVHASGTPLVMAPQTIGPFTKSWSTRAARASMHRSAIVASRDRLSTDAARDMGVKNVIEASDVALRLPYDTPTRRSGSQAPKVGLNVSGLLMSGGYTGKNEFGIKADYPALIRELIGFFQGEGAEVHLVAHVLPETAERTHLEDDTAANAQLSEEFPGVIEAPRFATPSEAKSYIAGLDFFMGARMHACIAAFSAGVPVVPMAYSRKFEGLFGTIGYHRTVDCTRDSAQEIASRIKEAYHDRNVIRTDLGAALERGQNKLDRYVDALRTLLGGTR